MPTLPASGYPVPQAPSVEPLATAPGGFQDIHATTDMFGGASALALSNLGQSFEKVAGNLASIQDQYDTVVAREARNRALDYSQKLLYTPETGYFDTQGRTALDRQSETLKNLEDVYKKERANLPTAQAQRLFDEGSSASRLHNQALVLHHASQQFQKFRAKEAESEVGLKLNEVSSASTRGDLTAFNQSLGEAIITATQALRDRGASDAEIKAKASDLTATAVEYWSLGRAPTDPVGALAALEANKEHFTDPSHYARLYAQIKGHADKEAGRKLVESTTGAASNTDIPPEGRALLDSIAGPESGGRYDVRYTPSGGTPFDPAKGHPRIPEPGPSGPSTAAGRYQIVASTYDRFAPGLGITDFSPRSQDTVAWAIAQDAYRKQTGGDLLEALRAGKTQEVQKALRDSQQWTTANLGGYAANLQKYGTPPATEDRPVTIAGQNGKLYPLTKAESDQYYSIKEPGEAQHFLEGTAKAPQGIPESPLAGQVARIQASNATPEVKEAAIAELHRQHTISTMGQDEAKYELTRGIVRGDPSITPEYIDTLVKSNRISPAAGTEALADLAKEQKARQKLADGIALVSAAGAGGAPLDPKNTEHKKALDAHYELTSSLWPAPTQPNETLNRSIAYSVQYGMVPEKLRAAIRGGLHSARPDLAVQAANTITTLRNSNPELVADLGDEADMRLANLINTYASAGMAPDKAVELATESLKVTPAIREARAADYDLQRGKAPKDRSDSDDKWIASQQNSIWVRDPDIDPMMRTEFAETAKAEFQRTGNLEASRRMALDTVNRVWGRSEVGGDRRYVKQAPEKFYSIPTLTPAENSRWMNEQLLSDVGKGALQDPSNPITSDRLRLIPDPTRTNGGNPVYQVWLVQPNKGWEQVVDVKGAPIRWHPDYSTSADRKRRDDAAAAEIEKARTLRREQGEREQMVPDPRRYRTGP